MCDVNDSAVIAHFFGGPKDGEHLTIEKPDDPLIFPRLDSLLFPDDDPDPLAQVKVGHLIYRRRGTPIAGHAYYDHDPNG